MLASINEGQAVRQTSSRPLEFQIPLPWHEFMQLTLTSFGRRSASREAALRTLKFNSQSLTCRYHPELGMCGLDSWKLNIMV